MHAAIPKPAAKLAGMVAICPKCHTSNRPRARFCMTCVTSLATAVADGGDDDDEPFFLEERTALVEAPGPGTLAADERIARASVSPFAEHALPEGTQIEGFRIIRTIGEGGFGIVYLAWDSALERHVAIKEYMPSSLAVRANATLSVSMRSEGHRETFEAGLKSFVNEARLLARFDHPSLVKVFRFWEANQTAYMAMPYYEGPTLKAVLAGVRGHVPEEAIREWLLPLLDALTVLHREQCYHRDISPDNILLTDGGPLLLDFGAARRVISDRTQALTTMLKPGFAPIEQYGGAMMQGPWTDLYALAGVVYYAITGRLPLASVVRVVTDTLKPLAVTHAGQYGDGFLRAIDAALAVKPDDRPQDVAQFREALNAGLAPDSPLRFAPSTPRDPVPHDAEAGPTEPMPVAVEPIPEDISIDTVGAPVGPLSDAPRRRLTAIYGLAAAAVLAAGVALWWARTPDVPPAASVPASAMSASPTAPPVATPPVSPPTPAPVLPPAPVIITPAPSPAADAIEAPAAKQPTLAPAPASAPAQRAPVPRAPKPVAERAKPAIVVPLAIERAHAPKAEPEVTSSYTEASKPPRCGDLVLKSSLEPLQSEEVAFLKSKCR